MRNFTSLIFIIMTLMKRSFWYCIMFMAALVITLGITSSEREQPSIQHLQEMIDNFSHAINLDIQKDFEVYHHIKQNFPIALGLYCSHNRINSSLICNVIRGSLRSTFNTIKDYLSRGESLTLSAEFVQEMVPWKDDLLITILEVCNPDINQPLCQLKGYSPLDYSIISRQYRSTSILIGHNASVTPSSLYYAITNQNSSLVGLLYTSSMQDGYHSTTNDSNLLPSFMDLSLVYCWLGFDSCQMYDSFLHEMNTFKSFITIDSKLINILIFSSMCSMRNNQSGPVELFYNRLPPLHGGWLVYEDQLLLGSHDCHVPRININDITDITTFQNLFQLRIPFILYNVRHFAKLKELWKKSNLRRSPLSNTDVLAGSIPYGQIFGERFGVASVREYLTYMDEYSFNPVDFNNGDNLNLPLYVFDGEVMDEEFKPYLDDLPEFYSLWNYSHFHHQFILGPRGSGAPFHYHCSALNYLTYGRKKWFLYSPDKAIYSKIHPLHWYMQTYKTLSKEEKPFECIQLQNELFYVPSGWAHATINIDECIGLATEFDTKDC